jgi:CheY-like chemotaxis protein
LSRPFSSVVEPSSFSRWNPEMKSYTSLEIEVFWQTMRLNGIEAAKKILQSSPGTRIVLFSGQAETTQLLADARRAGYRFEVLAKPVSPAFLLKKLKNPSPD